MTVVRATAEAGVDSPVTAALGRHIQEVRRALDTIAAADVARVVQSILDAADRGAHVYIAGNGGSASTASHFACDLSKSTALHGHRRLRVTSLTDSVALVTAWANDTSYERAFAEHLTGLVQPADVLLTISVSGNSPNVLAAVAVARERGARTVALVGRGGGALSSAVDIAVQVDSQDYGVVEDCHLAIQHAVTASVRSALSV